MKSRTSAETRMVISQLRMMRLWAGLPNFLRWHLLIRILGKHMQTSPPEQPRSMRQRMQPTTFWRFHILLMKWEFLFQNQSTCRWTTPLPRSLSMTRHTRPSSNTLTCDRNGFKLFETRAFFDPSMLTPKTTQLTFLQRYWGNKTSFDFGTWS